MRIAIRNGVETPGFYPFIRCLAACSVLLPPAQFSDRIFALAEAISEEPNAEDGWLDYSGSWRRPNLANTMLGLIAKPRSNRSAAAAVSLAQRCIGQGVTEEAIIKELRLLHAGMSASKLLEEPLSVSLSSDKSYSSLHTWLRKWSNNKDAFYSFAGRLVEIEVEYWSPDSHALQLALRPEPRSHLFISHATNADSDTANALVAALEAAGQPCWIAPRDIPAGADWNGSILAAIEACAGVVLLVSEASVASRFVQAEIQHAFEHGKRIVPALLDPSAQPAMIDLRLKTIQHIPPSKDSGLSARAILAAAS